MLSQSFVRLQHQSVVIGLGIALEFGDAAKQIAGFADGANRAGGAGITQEGWNGGSGNRRRDGCPKIDVARALQMTASN